MARFGLKGRLTPDDIASLTAAYEAGASANQLAAEYRICRASVVKLLSEAGVPLRTLGLSDAQITEAAELYASGWSLQRLGDRYGSPPNTVRAALLRVGVTLRRRRGWNYD